MTTTIENYGIYPLDTVATAFKLSVTDFVRVLSTKVKNDRETSVDHMHCAIYVHEHRAYYLSAFEATAHIAVSVLQVVPVPLEDGFQEFIRYAC